jgi:acyl transferase domain-containing protein
LALVGKSKDEFVKKLSLYLDNPERTAPLISQGGEKLNDKIVFMFTGQGSQYVGLGRELYQVHPVFKSELERCDTLFRPHTGRSIIRLIYGNEGEDPGPEVERAIYAQPIIFSIQYALIRLWESWGVAASAVVGHSIGEYAAACCAGILSLENAVRLVALRGTIMESMPRGGKMVGLLAGEDFVKPLVQPYSDSVSIAAVNAPGNVTISGETNAVHAVIQKVKACGVFIEELNISHAFHSVSMEPYVAQFQKQIAAPAIGAPISGTLSVFTTVCKVWKPGAIKYSLKLVEQQPFAGWPVNVSGMKPLCFSLPCAKAEMPVSNCITRCPNSISMEWISIGKRFINPHGSRKWCCPPIPLLERDIG